MTKITINPVYQWDDSLDAYVLVSHDVQYCLEDSRIPIRADRAASNEAKQAQATAAANASQYGAEAGGINGPLQQFDMQNLLNPQGFGQRGVGEMLTAALGGAGGSSSSIEGEEQLASKRGTTGENTALMDSLARQRLKAGAGSSEGVAASDVQAKLGQQQSAADDLSRRYGIDVQAQLGQGKLQNDDINTQIEAGKSGWFQNLMQGIAVVTGAADSTFGAGGPLATAQSTG